MAREKVYRFRCSDCPDCFIYEKTDLRKVPGAVLKFGERYCRGSKKVREFKRRDPKVYPPSWCPKRKSPAQYRVYAYKNTDAWYLSAPVIKCKKTPKKKCNFVAERREKR